MVCTVANRVAVADVLGLGVAFDHHTPRVQRLSQDGFDLRLTNEQEVRKGGVDEGELVEFDAHDSPAKVQQHARGDVTSREESTGDTERPEHLQRPRVHDQRPRRAELIGSPLDDADGGAVIEGLQRERETRRARSDDDDVRSAIVGCHESSTWVSLHQAGRRPGATAPSSAGSSSTSSWRRPGTTM